jgi:methionyl-tRNA formyltransferase
MIESILFFGTRCSFADRVLQTLNQNGFEIAARVIPGQEPGHRPLWEFVPRQAVPSSRSAHQLPMAATPPRDRGQGTGESFPTIAINDHQSTETIAYLRSIHADIAVVCCYPRRLPMVLVESAKMGGINIHPSLLPAYRGPEPLFWIYRNGEHDSGVTLHRVAASLDAGPILAQERISVATGMPGDELWFQSASIGAKLLVHDVLGDGREPPAGTPQTSENASYYSWPTPNDLAIVLDDWEAWRVFHFCRGVIPLGYHPRVTIAGTSRVIEAALDYSDERGRGIDRLSPGWYRCASGAIQLVLATPMG